MIFLLDENFPKAAGKLLNDLGHQVIDFRDAGCEGAPDEKVIAYACSHSAIILTTDRDFIHTAGRTHTGHFGIIVIALKQPNRESIVAILIWFSGKFGDRDLAGHAFQLRDRAWQVFPSMD